MRIKHHFCKFTKFLCNRLAIVSYILFISASIAAPVSTVAQAKAETSKQATIVINATNKPISSILKNIEKQSKYVFVYNAQQVNLNSTKTINVNSASIASIMNSLLAGTGYNYEISDRQILILKPNTDSDAKKFITGTVIDDNGDPLIGVTVQVKGTNDGAITDFEGNYSVNASPSSTLVFSYVGYTKKESKATPNMTVKLNSQNELLNELVVVGYGAVKKSDLTGSVSAINEKDFNKGLVSSATQLIQGRVPGVNITSNDGEPGGGVTIRVRGSNSIRSGQEPLYVVDGVPLDISDDLQPSGASIAGVGSSGNKNPLNFLNPDDIASMDILKDASATAIYGARGANGVIMITTKKGQEGRSKASYSGSISISQIRKQYDILSGDEYRALAKEKGVTIEDGGANNNYQDEIFRTAFSHNHNLSLSGGVKNGTYRVSLGYQNQEGIVRKSGMEKYTGRFSINQKFFNDRLSLEASLLATRTNDQRAPLGQSGGYEGDLILTALKLNPTLPIYNEDGTYFQKSPDTRNPVAMIDLTNDNTRTDRILANFNGTFEIIKGLKYKLNLAFDETTASRKVTQNAQLVYMTDKGMVDVNNVEAGNFLVENYFTYDFNIKDTHKFNLLAGHSYQRFKNYRYGMHITGFDVDNIDYIYDFAFGNNNTVTATSDVTKNELQSFFGRVNYNLMDKYLFTVNLRADGSTKFGANNKYGFFPSAAAAWRMSEEKFIRDLDVFNNLKLRLSWGITGNQEIPNKISQVMLGSTSGAILDGGSTATPGITLTRTPNPNLKWERTEQVDLGLDFAFFKNRLSGTIDLYSKTTKDVLLEVYSISPAPTTKVWSNVADMQILNKGIEIGLNGIIIDTRDWNWGMGINFATFSNEVRNLPMESITTAQPSGPGITGFNAQVIKSGYSIGTFWGYNFLGFDEDGHSIYETDEDGKKVEKCIGNAQPDFTMNLSTNLRWKNFDMSLFFNGVFGNDVYNNLANVIDNMSMFAKGNNTTHSAASSTEALDNVLDYSSRYIENGSYVRLSSASLGYTVPLKKNNYISNIRLSVTGNNLFVISSYSGYDPEVNASRSSNGVPSLGIGWTSYPQARSFSFGATIDF